MEVKDLTWTTKKETVINGIGFSLKPGEILAVLGPDGAGKTTLLKILAGIIDPTSGHIYLRGFNIRENPTKYKQLLGYVPEQPNIFPHLNAIEYLQLVGRLYMIDEDRLEEKIHELLEHFRFGDKMVFPASTYSRGTLQKLMICAALIHNPDLVLIDEPLTGLDIASALILKALLEKLADSGKQILCATRTLEVAEQICTRALILNKGILVSSNPVKDLRNLMDLPLLESILKEMVGEQDIEDSAQTLFTTIDT